MSHVPLYIGKRKLLSTAVASAMTLCAFYSPASLAEDNKTLEEVYVTATKRDERLIDVPMAVTALAGDELLVQNMLQVEDFVDQVPGLSIQKSSNFRTRIILRGLNAGGAGATVASMIDEAALSFSSALGAGAAVIADLDTLDLARIEVLRGPQGTLYGAAAEGGIIKYVTNPPNLEEFEGDVDLTWENVEDGDSGYTARGLINIPLAKGKAALRASAFFKDIPGFIDNPLNGRSNANSGERSGFRAQLLFHPTDNLSIRLQALAQDQEMDDTGQVEVIGAAFDGNNDSSGIFEPANGGDLEWNTFSPGLSENEIRLYSATVNWNRGNVNFLSATSYGEVLSGFRTDIAFSEYVPGVVNITDAFSAFFGVPAMSVWSDQENSFEKINQEFRISSIESIDVGAIELDWQMGAFYSEEDIVFDQYYDAIDPNTGEILLTPIFAGFGVPLVPLGGSSLPADYEELSFFGEVVLHITEKFEVAIGGRHSSNEQWSQVISVVGLITAPFPIVNDPYESDEDELTWSIAPKYYLAEDQLLYARIASGYRPGGPSWPIPGAPPDFPTSFDADRTVNYEIGIKGQTDDGSFAWDVAAFFIDWEDIQVPSSFVSPSSGVTYTITGNAGLAESKGLEWDISWQLTDSLGIGFIGAYVNAELTSDAAGMGGYSGDMLAYVPELSATLNIKHSAEINGVPVRSTLSWRHTGERFTTFAAPFAGTPDPKWPGSHMELPSYNTISANISATLDQFRVRLFVENLTDEWALTDYIAGGGSLYTGTGVPIQPRTIGVSVGYSF